MKEDVWTCAVCGVRKEVVNYYLLSIEVFVNQKECNAMKVCKECKAGLDRVVRKKERELLMYHPEIYKEAFLEYLRRR